jgi:hypothetical protein
MKIDISLTEKLDSHNPGEFISNYKISNFFKGKFFIKRLIKKIFIHKINTKIRWNESIWDSIIINDYFTKIIFLDSNLSFDLNEIKASIIKDITDKRLKDIKKYQKLILNEVDIGFPLFITGRALNFLGGNESSNDIYILDGSRRLVSNILLNIDPAISIIDLK